MCLKKQKVVAPDKTHVQMLDPMVAMLADCLDSRYVLVSAPKSIQNTENMWPVEMHKVHVQRARVSVIKLFCFYFLKRY